MIGLKLIGARRIKYTVRDNVTDPNGPLELTFDSGAVRLIASGPDGELLAIRAEPWADPFAEPLSPENRTFVEKSGKWTAYDDREFFIQVLGDSLDNVDFGRNCDGLITSAILKFGDLQILLDSDGDELQVSLFTH